MKKKLSILTAVLLIAAMFAGCAPDAGNSNGTTAPATSAATSAPTSAPATSAPTEPASSDFDLSELITVISREDGSGTRGAFIELMGIEQKDDTGKKTDRTTKDALIANKTDVVLMQVSGDPYAIGYISLGSLNNTVKALHIDGVEPTVDNIIAGTYKVARPFNIATKGEPTGIAKDFIDFILSSEGQKVVVDAKYIEVVANAPAFSSAKPTGKLVIAGSSSVTPVMEKLVEAYEAINTGADIEVQQSDSTAGMTAAIDGIADIGMASRELKDAEKEQLTPIVIAMDGIAVVVNNENSLTDISSDSVRDIFIGELTTWDSAK